MTLSVVLSGSFLAYQYVNLISLCLVFLAIEIKKRKKVSNWLFLMRRLSSSSDVSAASEPELKTSLFEQPLSAICSDNTLPGPIQVRTRSPFSFLWNVLGKPERLSHAELVGVGFSVFFPCLEMVFPPKNAVRGTYTAAYILEISRICQWAQADGTSILLT